MIIRRAAKQSNEKGQRDRVTHVEHVRIPRANVIDLRKVQREKEAAKKNLEREPSVFTRLMKMRIPTVRLNAPKQPIAELIPPPEKVIVSKQYALPRQPSRELNSTSSEKMRLGTFSLITGWQRRLLLFITICLLIVVPFFGMSIYKRASDAKGSVLGITSAAYESLQQAGSMASAADFLMANENFQEATEGFIAAQAELEQAGGSLLTITKLLPGKVKSAQYLLSAGKNVSEAGADITDVISNIDSLKLDPFKNGGTSLTEFLIIIRDGLSPALSKLEQAADDLAQVRPEDLPDEYRDSMRAVQEAVPSLQQGFNSFYTVADVMLEVLGHERPKRYLIIFQNSRELRPTGGFIGSLALVDIYRGSIENLEVPGGGIYDLAGQLNEKLIAPKPLWLVNPHWNIQDSNWFPDYPTSAQKLMWFFERTGGASVDGVIALTPAVIENLMRNVGAINMQELYGVTVDHTNFVREAQYWAEVTYDREENMPKKFIGDLLPLLLDKVFSPQTDQLLGVSQTFYRALIEKDLLLYFTDPAVEAKVAAFAGDGSMMAAEQDYLAVVNTNIAGGKTDHVVDQFIGHEAQIAADGSVTVTTTVTRSHTGNELDRWEKVANVSYLRFYVPLGSELLSAEGFDEILPTRFLQPDLDAVEDADLVTIEKGSTIDEESGVRTTAEFGKTVYGNWVSIDPGEIQQVRLQYRLPFSLDIGGVFGKADAYSLFVQKQPGAQNVYLSSTVTIDPAYEVVWNLPGTELIEHGVEYLADLSTDQFYGVVIRK
ncbi:MAG: DUF4012 domain-containing protein [Patescibacteria group bacterium]